MLAPRRGGNLLRGRGALRERLEPLEVRSRGFLALRDHLTAYVRSSEFTPLQAETSELRERLSSVRYAVRIRGPKVSVRR
jgi:hypothetical protein